MRDNHPIHISSEHKLFDLKLTEVFRYRGLIWLFTSRAFKVTYKQTILGPLWLFINPLLTSVVHTVLFGNIAKISTGGVPQLLFYLSGNAIWGYFSNCISGNAAAFSGNAGLFSKVYFPRLTMPLANILSLILRFGIQMVLILGFILYYTFSGVLNPSPWALLVVPAVLIQLGVMGMGFGIIVSSVTTKYRDLGVLVGFGLNLWMYATPVVYPLSTVGDAWLRQLLLYNPVSAPIELYRYVLLGSGTVLPLHLVVSSTVTVAVALIGIIIFNRVERTFVDTV